MKLLRGFYPFHTLSFFTHSLLNLLQGRVAEVPKLTELNSVLPE